MKNKTNCKHIKTGQYNFFLDSLKGVSIILIIFTHFCGENKKTFMMGFPFWVDMAVPILMIVSGYVYTLQYERNRIKFLSDAYSYKNWIGGAIRYTLPFGIVYLVETIYRIIKFSDHSIENIFYGFLQGGNAPGSYYYPIMIQFIFLFPLIYFCIKNTKQKEYCFV